MRVFIIRTSITQCDSGESVDVYCTVPSLAVHSTLQDGFAFHQEMIVAHPQDGPCGPGIFFVDEFTIA